MVAFITFQWERKKRADQVRDLPSASRLEFDPVCHDARTIWDNEVPNRYRI